MTRNHLHLLPITVSDQFPTYENLISTAASWGPSIFDLPVPGLAVDVRQLSTEHSANVALTPFEGFRWTDSIAISDNDGSLSAWHRKLRRSSASLVGNWDGVFLTSASALEARFGSMMLQALSNIECRYLPWASIRIWRCRCTWPAKRSGL